MKLLPRKPGRRSGDDSAPAPAPDPRRPLQRAASGAPVDPPSTALAQALASYRKGGEAEVDALRALHAELMKRAHQLGVRLGGDAE
jgi:hypothetical protein